MAHTFKLTIARVGENLFDGEVVSVTLPGQEGAFTVLADHEAFVTPLKTGKAILQTSDGAHRTIALPESGIAEVSGNQATIIL